jgi:hypothetical protein
VNGGLARSESRRVKPSAGASNETYVVSRTFRVSGGSGSAQGSGWREIVIQRFTHRPKRCVGRGTGVVKTTGSYEESLSTEGIPDHHEASSFTGRRQRWSRQAPHHCDPYEPTKRRTYGQVCSFREGGRGARVNPGACDRGVRGSIASAPWEENAHAHAFLRKGTGTVLDDDPPKRSRVA